MTLTKDEPAEAGPLLDAPPEAPKPDAQRSIGAIIGSSLRLVRQNRRQTLLPLAVTMMPFIWFAAIAEFVLLNNVYTDSPYDSIAAVIEKAPPGLQATLAGVSWILALFSLVGFAATIVAVRGVMEGRKVPLAQALDPAFTRMGGLFALGAIAFALWMLAALLAVTVIGTAFVLFVMLRLSLSVHAFMLEGTRVLDSCRVTWRLARGHMFRVLGLFLATLPIGLIAVFCALIAAVIVTIPFAPASPGRQGTLVIGALGVSVAGIVLVPFVAFVAAATTMLYTELRGHDHAGPGTRN
ncbi:MAG: hypothetical protein ACRDG3_06615 [Tepidiformaceae bacterium]